MTTDAPEAEAEPEVTPRTGEDEDGWEATMRDVSHTPEVGDRVPGVWRRGDE